MKPFIILVIISLTALNCSCQNLYETYISKIQYNLSQKKYDLAEYYVEKGLIQYPDSLTFHILNGQLKLAQDSTQIALESFNNAILLDTTSSFSYYNRSKVYRQLGEFTLMCEDILKAVNLSDDYIYTAPFSEAGCFKILDMYSPDSKYNYPPPPTEMPIENRKNE